MGLRAIEDVLFPGVDVDLERLVVSPDLLLIEAAARGKPPRCPDCATVGRRVHSTYWRTLAERPAIGRRLAIRLRVRRYFCDRKRCGRLTFVEQVGRLSERHRRSSLGLKQWLRSIAVELGGRAGERLCRVLHLQAGRTRLLELLEAPEVPARAPRVLGVDEFAFRRGRTYGTVLVDIEAGTVVDVLPDRTSETFATWLREHPGTEIVCRDRATAYTKAVKEAAPDAIEVAGRWHLLQNLGRAVEKTCQQHRALRKQADQDEPQQAPAVVLPTPVLPRTPIIERTRERYASVHRLVDRGWTVSAIARHLQLDRKTVRRFRDTPLDELLASAKDFGIHRRDQLVPFMPYLHARVAAGIACPDITRACDLARSFHDLLTHLRGQLLLEWIRQAEQDAPGPVRSFAGFLRQDLDAVTAGLTLEWSSGRVAGNVNRIKTLKRAMYGRASFRLLRIRILTRP